MKRSEFFKKLFRSLFLITALAALSYALSGRSKGTCPKSTTCSQCQIVQTCSLTQKK